MKFLLIKSLTAAICQTPKHINLLACNLAIDRCHNSTCTINRSSVTNLTQHAPDFGIIHFYSVAYFI